MVGSADSIAAPNTALNTVLAEAFCNAADALEGADDFEAACRAYIKESLTKHKRIIFNGDGYSDEWVEELLPAAACPTSRAWWTPFPL